MSNSSLPSPGILPKTTHNQCYSHLLIPSAKDYCPCKSLQSCVCRSPSAPSVWVPEGASLDPSPAGADREGRECSSQQCARNNGKGCSSQLWSHSPPLIHLPCLPTQRSDKTKMFSFLLPYFWEYWRIQHLGYPPKLQDTKNPCSKLVRSNIWDLTIQIPRESLLVRTNMEQINTFAFI